MRYRGCLFDRHTWNSVQSHGMAEATPGTANSGETGWQRRLNAPQTVGKHGVTEATRGTANRRATLGMAEATPGIANSAGYLVSPLHPMFPRRLRHLEQTCKRFMIFKSIHSQIMMK